MKIIESVIHRFKSMYKIRELRRRIVFTLLMFAVARVGIHIPVPGVNVALFKSFTNNTIAQFLDLFSGGAVQRASIFSLGIIPYINSSIIFQLLGVLYPKIEEMQREGGKQRDKITQWTRYLTIITSIAQSIGIAVLLQSQNLVIEPGITFILTTVALMTGGTAFLMWVAERISIKGIGNGTSMLIFLNIVSNLPTVARTMKNSDTISTGMSLLSLFLFILLILVLVIIQLGERRIPIQYVGKSSRGVNGNASSVGRKTYLPIKINTAGVMPIIFSSMIMGIPPLLILLVKDPVRKASLNQMFGPTGYVYLIMFVILIVLFSFFYTAIVFDPDKIADSLKQSGGTIPLKRAGKETADYLEYVATRITFGTAIFLAILGILPNVWFGYILHSRVLIGGTSVLILIGVGVDLLQQIDSRLAVKKYKGFTNRRR